MVRLKHEMAVAREQSKQAEQDSYPENGGAARIAVRDLGNFHYEMESVSDSEFEGCPGEGSPSDKHPWLSAEQLRALPY